MIMNPSIEQRLEAVERAVAELQSRLAGAPQVTSWIERFTGSFKDEPAFAEVVAHGRALRMKDRIEENDA